MGLGERRREYGVDDREAGVLNRIGVRGNPKRTAARGGDICAVTPWSAANSEDGPGDSVLVFVMAPERLLHRAPSLGCLGSAVHKRSSTVLASRRIET